MEKIQHFCHQQHVLHLMDNKTINDQIICELCKSSIDHEDSHYVCDLCKYHVHKSCEELPKEMSHPSHPRHPLILRSKFIWCNSCGKTPQKNLMFNCEKCKFDLDIECVHISNSMTKCPQGKHCIQHSSHPHLLLFIETMHKDIDVRCFACQSEASSPSDDRVYYGCIRCEYFLHKQCIDQLPQQIQTSHHPNHTTLSLLMKRNNCICKVCKYSNSPALYYECPQCDFELCLECGVKRPRIIKYEDHPHLLCLMEKANTTTSDQCNVYDTCLKQPIIFNSKEFHETDAFIFRCLDCNFKLHFLCGPLPSTISYEGHVHMLDLVDSFIENKFGEYCCDICEEERNPRIRVYSCSKCIYVAHVHCLISEIINVLKGDLRHVKLKVLGEDLWKFPKEMDYEGVKKPEKEKGTSLLTLMDLINELNDDEKRWLKYHIYWDENQKGKEEVVVSKKSSTNRLEALRFSSLTEDEFMSVIFEEFDSTYYKKKLKIKSSDLALKIADVKGYFIPFNLVPAMKSLLHKYGDISSKSDDSQTFKSVCYFIVCKVMKEMHTTFVTDITKDVLQQWYHYITFVEFWGTFNVLWLRASLEKITRAFYYQQVSKLLDMDIAAILEDKILDLRMKIVEYKRFRDSCLKSKEGSVKKGFEEAMKFKWSVASEIGF